MKKFYRIFLASVLALSLLTGSIGIPVFAEEAETAEQEEVLSGAAPESNETAGQEEASLSSAAPERNYYSAVKPLKGIITRSVRQFHRIMWPIQGTSPAI